MAEYKKYQQSSGAFVYGLEHSAEGFHKHYTYYKKAEIGKQQKHQNFSELHKSPRPSAAPA